MKVYPIIKRIIDFILSLIILVLLSPILLLAAIAIKIEDPQGPIFFTQKRVGVDKTTFKLYKFRTMKTDKEAERSFDFSKDNQRITRVGKFLRRTKIDELPQLINVLKGDMSLVGPRPTVMKQVQEYDDFQLRRLDVRPGMTGLAQVNGNVSLLWEDRIKYDVYYVDNLSFLMDLIILFKTVFIVILGEEKFITKPEEKMKSIV